MTDWISVIAASGALGSFLAALFIYWSQKRQNQSTEVARLHQMWWSNEIKGHRELAFKCVQEWNDNGKTVTPLIKSYRDNTTDYAEEKNSIAIVAFFFADLNAMLDEGLVNEKLAFRIFGDAQFFWFSSFLLSIGNELEIKGSTTRDNENRVVRWVTEIRELDKRFNQVASK